MRTLRVLIAVAAVVGLGCAGGAVGPPRIEIDRTACAHCGMLVSDAVFSSAYRIDDRPARVFDDLACLVTDLRRTGRVGAATVWVHDAANGEWMDGRTAAFVRSPSVRTPMNGGVLAYRDEAAARRAAAAPEARVLLSFEALVADLGKEGVQ